LWAAAYQALPPADPLERWRGGALDGPARAIVDLLLVTFLSVDGKARMRAARALAMICREAGAIVSTAGGAA
jgi:hypothetical protein